MIIKRINFTVSKRVKIAGINDDCFSTQSKEYLKDVYVPVVYTPYLGTFYKKYPDLADVLLNLKTCKVTVVTVGHSFFLASKYFYTFNQV